MIFHKDKIADSNEKTEFCMFANPTRDVVKEQTNEHRTDRPPSFVTKNWSVFVVLYPGRPKA